VCAGSLQLRDELVLHAVEALVHLSPLLSQALDLSL
jgi:hypothetical protein